MLNLCGIAGDALLPQFLMGSAAFRKIHDGLHSDPSVCRDPDHSGQADDSRRGAFGPGMSLLHQFPDHQGMSLDGEGRVCYSRVLDRASITSTSCEESWLPPPRPIRALNICVTRAVPGSAMPRVWASSSTIWMSL